MSVQFEEDEYYEWLLKASLEEKKKLIEEWAFNWSCIRKNRGSKGTSLTDWNRAERLMQYDEMQAQRYKEDKERTQNC